MPAESVPGEIAPTALSTPGTRMVADIGGTNTRLALFDPETRTLRARRAFVNREYGGLEDIIARWLDELDSPAPPLACLAVAAPPSGDTIAMLNIDWTFSLTALAQRFGFDRVHAINDFLGNAYALPHLAREDIAPLRAGEDPGATSKLAVMGPGTGLGGATLDRATLDRATLDRATPGRATPGRGGAAPVACACEPGHMGLAAGTELELELFRALYPEYGEVYAELLVSGPGLVRLYRGLARVLGRTCEELGAQEISARALSGACDLCVTTLHTWCALLGSACGDFVLANGAYGGLYLAGGILPSTIGFLGASAFSARFGAKGQMRDYLARVPLAVITTADLGLIGAAHAPL